MSISLMRKIQISGSSTLSLTEKMRGRKIVEKRKKERIALPQERRTFTAECDDDGNKDPSMLTFIYKTGFTDNIDGNTHKPERKNSKRKKVADELCSYTGNEDNELCSNTSNDTCGMLCVVG